MHVIQAPNINHAYSDGMRWLETAGLAPTDSRYGSVIVAPGPVCTVYHKPRERVLFNPTRDANPFFHFFESLWMLGGREDLAFLEQFNKKMAEFSEDGEVFHGAYGHRWRHHFASDQLEQIVDELSELPNSRRAVLTMWDPDHDLHANNPDIPCNTHAYIDTRGEHVNMTVCCRSNDAVWGAYGANAVHFSYLLEFLACALVLPVGVYRQFSNNFHIYTDMPRFKEIWENALVYDMYEHEVAPSPPLFYGGNWRGFLIDLEIWLDNPCVYTGNLFLDEVATPMFVLWNAHKLTGWQMVCDKIAASDWKLACREWIKRRQSDD